MKQYEAEEFTRPAMWMPPAFPTTRAAIIDAMGAVRNNASLAHPNEELLGHDEALLAINLGRWLRGYFDAKLTGATR